MSVKTILVSQPKPETEKSPYFDLADKYKLKIDFRPFIQVEGVNTKDFREQKVDLTKFTGVIFTSKTGVDHFFRIAEESRFKVPETMKYFCLSEAIAFYLQKYVVYRKRKIFYGKSTIAELAEILKKHKGENFLLPCSDILKQDIPATLTATNISYTKVVLYRTVAADLSDLSDVKYDLLVFFSPAGIESLFKNFPKFKQNTTCIAAFGPTTANAVLKHNLRLDIHAPQPAAPSMTMAIEQFIKNGSKK
ncbi:MAG: uroporphyrinogen-III synthase [Crocinitomicaceae bacterium]|nr:uroporphyrinogen-III synthase [Crocinitomicaceae bacterium]